MRVAEIVGENGGESFAVRRHGGRDPLVVSGAERHETRLIGGAKRNEGERKDREDAEQEVFHGGDPDEICGRDKPFSAVRRAIATYRYHNIDQVVGWRSQCPRQHRRTGWLLPAARP